MSVRRITIGTDPEFFLRRTNTNSLISAIPFIKGGKHDPEILPCGAGLQSDNVAVEFATPPAGTTDDFISKMRVTFSETLTRLPEGTELAVLPSADFDPKELSDPKAREFGCSPDACAWELKENDFCAPANENFRSCGGHVHVGCLNMDGKPTHPEAQFLLDLMGKIWMVRGMDTFHGIISTILDASEAAVARRDLYGKAGCHRFTDYGVEYRVLSNYWTKTPYSSMLISSLTDDVVELIVQDKLESLIEEIGSEDIQRIINTGNSDDAKIILNKYLMQYLSEDSKFYLEECIAKLDKAESIVKEWSIGA